MDFSDPAHSAADVTYQGSTTYAPASRLDATLTDALNDWQQRSDTTAPDSALFQRADTQCFVITYDGKTSDYWPDENRNWLSESLVRDCLYRDGICIIEDTEPKLFDVRYKVEAVEGTEHLLICPYPTAAGNIGGIVVVCANRRLNKPERAPRR